MPRYTFMMIGSQQPVHVDIPVSFTDLHELVCRSRFVAGNLAEPDEAGICSCILIATGRIQCILTDQ